MTAPIVTEADRGRLYALELLEVHSEVFRALREKSLSMSADLGTLWQRVGDENSPGPIAGKPAVMFGTRKPGWIGEERVHLPNWRAEIGMQVEGRDVSDKRY